MTKLLAIGVTVATVVGLVGALWVANYRDRANAAQVTQAAYAKFGDGTPIHCVAQDSNHETWYCRSPRWGEDPNCRKATVSITGSIDIADETRACEGAPH
jgi:hypothetical protein